MQTTVYPIGKCVGYSLLTECSLCYKCMKQLYSSHKENMKVLCCKRPLHIQEYGQGRAIHCDVHVKERYTYLFIKVLDF